MRFLVIGTGSIGRRHLANLRHLLPHASIDLLSSRGAAMDAPPEANRVVTTIEQSLEQGLTGAVIASPAPWHVAQSLQLLKAGVPVLVEKPLSTSTDGVAELLNSSQHGQPLLMVGYTLRFHPALRALQSAITTGQAGKILAARFEVGQYLPDWRPEQDYRTTVSARADLGGGALLELSHEVDAAQWMLGPIQSVFAQIRRVSELEINVDDCVDLLVQFRSGCQATIHMDFLQRKAFRGYRLIGDRGTLEWNGPDQIVRLARSSSEPWETIHDSSQLPRNQIYLDEIQHFLQGIESKSEPLQTAQAAVHTMKVIEAARRSAEEGRVMEVAG